MIAVDFRSGQFAATTWRLLYASELRFSCDWTVIIFVLMQLSCDYILITTSTLSPYCVWVAYRVREAVLTAVVLQSQSNNFHCGQNTFHRGQNTFHCGQDRFHCSQFSIAVRVVLTAMKNEFDRGEKWSNHRQAYKGVKSCFKCSYRNFWPRSNLL